MRPTVSMNPRNANTAIKNASTAATAMIALAHGPMTDLQYLSCYDTSSGSIGWLRPRGSFFCANEHPTARRSTHGCHRFQDLPLADREREWDGSAAEERVRKWAGAEDGPNHKYRDAHVWYDAENKDNYSAYKLLIADVIDGLLTAVPRGVLAAGAVMQGSRGGVDLPSDDIDRVKSHLAKYYAKMGETAPWDR
jgi:hypothetical protein